ncbi:MAG TPA: hypothetical protein PKY66_09865 [Thermoflexales bacterium]|nr:hypothetical protein [Thermoflexales bacterium]HRA53517.1 hypothetical protein [Thermoflexales bacterium]
MSDIIDNSDCPFIRNLDDLPIPLHHLLASAKSINGPRVLRSAVEIALGTLGWVK